MDGQGSLATEQHFNNVGTAVMECMHALLPMRILSMPFGPQFNLFLLYLVINMICKFQQHSLIWYCHNILDWTDPAWAWACFYSSLLSPYFPPSSIIEQAWSMLRSYLEEHSGAQQCELQGCVARKLLSMGSSLPQWMIDRYKVRRKKSYVAGFEWRTLFFPLSEPTQLSCYVFT